MIRRQPKAKVRLLLLLALAQSLGLVQSQLARCLLYSSKNPITKKCIFFFYTLTDSVSEINTKYCRYLGGTTITIHNDTDQQFLHSTVRMNTFNEIGSVAAYEGFGGIALGLFREKNASCNDWWWPDRSDWRWPGRSDWRWTGRSKAEYTNWAPGQPKCDRYEASMDVKTGLWSTDKQWVQIGCEFEDSARGDGTCDGSYTFDWTSNKCYYAIQDCDDYYCSDAFCVHMYSTLPSIGDWKEEIFLKRYVMANHLGPDFHIALKYDKYTGKWYWTDDRKTTYRNWQDQYPKDSLQNPCAKMNAASGKWINGPCSNASFPGATVCVFYAPDGEITHTYYRE